MMSDRAIVPIIGVLAGMAACCIAGALLVVATSRRASPPLAAGLLEHGDAAVEVRIGERYLNRIFFQSAASYPSPWPIQDGRLDVLRGNQIRFQVRVKSPATPLTLNGLASIQARDGELDIRIVEVRVGQLPVTGLITAFIPEMERQVNAEANKQLHEHANPAKLKLVDVAGDDGQLVFFLSGQD